MSLHGAADRFPAGLVPVGERCWAWLQPNGTWGESNAGLICGDGASLLVDTLWDHALTRRMLEAMAPHLAGAPLTRVLNTHSDGDHWFGNDLVPAEAEIVASAPAAAIMATEDAAPMLRFQRLSGLLARLPGGPGAFGRYTRAMLGPFAFADVEVRRPDRSFSGAERLDVGGREVVATHVGPAHTPGDTIVHVPDAGVVYAADVLFVGVTPVMWAGPYESWIAALDTLLGLDARAYVPGHGPVCGRAEIEDLRAYWAWLGPAAAERHAAGLSAWEAARELALAPELSAGGWRDWDAPERIVVSVATIYRNLDGEPPSGSPLEVMRLFSRVAALSRYLAAA